MRLGRSILIAVLAVAAVAGAYSGYWFYARGVALKVFSQWIAARQAEGYRIVHQPARVEGFPFAIRMVLDTPSVAAADYAWHWHGESLVLEALPWNLHRYRLESLGTHRVSLTRDGKRQLLVAEPAEATAVATFWKNGQPKAVSIVLRDLRLSGDSGEWQAAEIWIEATQPASPPASSSETALTLSLAGADIVLPDTFNVPLGHKIASLRGDFRVLGAIQGGPYETALEAWRVDGGTVEVPWLRAVWDRVDLRAQGTLALDEDWRPMGSFSADIRGFAAGMDALADAAVIEAKTVTMAKIGLALMAKKPPEGGEAVLTLPVTAQSGQLYAGPIRIATLPSIRP